MLMIPMLLFQILISSLIGAVILRATCALFNMWFGKQTSPDQPQAVTQPPPPEAADFSSPYAPPMAPSTKSYGSIPRYLGVPEPNFEKAFLICLVTVFIQMIFGFILGFILGVIYQGQDEVGLRVVMVVCASVGSFLILAIACMVGLPTSFSRSLGVSGLFLVVALVVGLLIGLVIFVVSSLIGLGFS